MEYEGEAGADQLNNGALLLQGRPDGPRVWLSLSGGLPLRRALAAAVGRIDLIAAGEDQDQALMIREDRELLAALARLGREMARSPSG